MSASAPRQRRWLRTRLDATLSIVVLNVLAAIAAALYLWSSWTAEINEAEAQTRASARLLERAVAQALDKAALGAAAVASHVHRQWRSGHTDVADLWSVVDGVARRMPELQTVAVFDAQGAQICGQPPDRCRHVQVADRDFFRFYRDHPDAAPALFGPLVSRLDGTEVLKVVQPLRRPDRSFGGVVAAMLPADRLRATLQQVHVERRGVVSLRTIDMALVLRVPPQPANADPAQGTRISSELRGLLSRSPQEGLYRAPSGLDGIERLSAYRRLEGWPLYVLLGQAMDHVLEQWRRSAAMAALVLAVFACVSVLLARALRAQAASQARAAQLYDEAPCGYHTLDAQGRFITINQTALHWLGCTRADAVGRLGPADFMTDEGRQTFSENFSQLIATGRREVEFDLVGRSGVTRRVAVSASAVRNREGAFVCSNSVMYDISELHASRQQMQRLADEQARVLDTDLVGMAKVRDRRIVWANRGMGSLLGYEPGQWPGLPVQALFTDAAAYEQADAQCRAFVARGQPCRLQLQLQRRDGTRVWMDAGAAPLDPQGTEVLLMLVDITAQRQAEAARVRAAEMKAQNEQLRETSRLKDEFVANLSHELRTPLNGVLGFAQLLAMPGNAADPVKSKRYLGQIDASGRHLLQLIDSLLDFAKVEAGKLYLNRESVALGDAVRQSVDMLQTQADQHQVLVDVQYDPALATVDTDALRLRQVLTNLLDNAIKFSRPGGHVQVRTGRLAHDGWFVQVQDHGIGIAAKDMDRLFSPFEQLSAGSTKTHGGTGLGLAFVRRIARALGGDVVATSEPGHGSTFTLSMPASPPAGDTA